MSSNNSTYQRNETITGVVERITFAAEDTGFPICLTLVAIFPKKRHKSLGKETRKTSYIESFNYTVSQRVLRLVRKNLSFSKKLENQIRCNLAIC